VDGGVKLGEKRRFENRRWSLEQKQKPAVVLAAGLSLRVAVGISA
jgi:hypothetical protein